jgi:hypothetical protein
MTQGEVKALVGLLAFIAGTLLGGVVNALVGRYAAFKESKGVALAIRAEIEALVRLATYRNYIALTDAIIVRSERSHARHRHLRCFLGSGRRRLFQRLPCPLAKRAKVNTMATLQTEGA